MRLEATKLRLKGKTYSEIQNLLSVRIPKSTLSYWCKNIELSKRSQMRISKLSALNLIRGRQKALKVKAEAKKQRQIDFHFENENLWSTYDKNKDARKIALAMLYIAEGNKRPGSLVFGNSDADIIKIFLALLRSTYSLDETKFRVTVQCRADQDPDGLKGYWSKVTKISKELFYKAQIDQRTLGKPTRKIHYKGVCRIDYFSAIIDQELKYIARTLENR